MLANLTFKPQKKILRLQRLCKLSESNDKNSALCMVYKIAFPDTQSTKFAWNFVRDFSVPSVYCWKTMVPTNRTHSIEDENAVVESKLSDYGPSIPANFTFKIRYQLTALVLEGTITPLKMIDLIPHVQRLAKQHGADLTASAVRRLGKQIPMPAPGVGADNFNITTLVGILDESIKDSIIVEETSRDLNVKQKKHHHLALTYKATVTPTGTCLSAHQE
jgi:hypothetical protein